MNWGMTPSEARQVPFYAIKTWPEHKVTRGMADLRAVAGGYRGAWLQIPFVIQVRLQDGRRVRIIEQQLLGSLPPTQERYIGQKHSQRHDSAVQGQMTFFAVWSLLLPIWALSELVRRLLDRDG